MYVALLTSTKSCYEQNGLESCFAGFCHHHVTNLSVDTHAYYYPLFESETKTGL